MATDNETYPTYPGPQDSSVKYRDGYRTYAEAVEAAQADKDEAEGSYNPANFTVEETEEFLDSNPQEEPLVVAAEKDGKKRKGVLKDGGGDDE